MVEGEYHGGGDLWAVKLDSLFNIEWQKLYGGSHLDYQGNGILELENGYFFLGNTNSNDGDVSGFHGIPGELSTIDIWAVRIDLVGNIIWQRDFGDFGGTCPAGYSVHQTSDDGFIIVGVVQKTAEDFNCWMMKFNHIGSSEWYNEFGGRLTDEIPYSCIQLKDKSIICLC